MFGPAIKICCGPRCGAESGQRAIYAALEASVPDGLIIRPVMCQGECGLGVTLVLPDGEKHKIRDAREAAAFFQTTFKG